MTMYKKAVEQLQHLQAQLEEGVAPNSGESAIESEQNAAALADEIANLGASVAKMVAKAAESDPDKQVYGKAMKGKIGQLAEGHKVLSQQLENRRAELAPLADAARAEVAAAAETAEHNKIVQRKKIEEEESRRAADAQAKQQASDAAEAKKAVTEQQRVAQEAQLREEKQLAAAQAAGQEEQQHAKVAAELSRLETKRLQEEVQAKQAADLAAKQSEAAAKAAAAARSPAQPLLNPECQLLHLSRGRTELDGLLHQAGNRQLVVVDYSTGWCGPCRMMEPVLVAWARELGPRVVFIKVDAEAQGNRQLAASAGIRGYPTFHIYRQGTVVGEAMGGDRVSLRAKIDSETRSLAPLSGPGPSPAVALANAMSAMKRAVPPDAFMAAAKMLLACTTNIVTHPGDPKYCRIKVSNSRYNSAVGCRPYGKQCMAALGFRPIFEAAEEILLLDDPSPELPRVKAMLELAMGGISSGTASAASTPAAAAPASAAATSTAATTDTNASANGSAGANTEAPPAGQAAAGRVIDGAEIPDPVRTTSAAKPPYAPTTVDQTQQDDDSLTEEEQLERAIQMSLQDSSQQQAE